MKTKHKSKHIHLTTWIDNILSKQNDYHY